MTEAQALLQEGLAAFKARAYGDALRAWRALLKLEPDHVQVKDLVTRTEALASEGQIVNQLREELADLRAELAATRESRNELLLEMARIHRRYEEREARLWRAQEAREWELREALAQAELRPVQGLSADREVEYDALQMQVLSLRDELAHAHVRILELEGKLGDDAHEPSEFDGIGPDAGDEDLLFGGLIADDEHDAEDELEGVENLAETSDEGSVHEHQEPFNAPPSTEEALDASQTSQTTQDVEGDEDGGLAAGALEEPPEAAQDVQEDAAGDEAAEAPLLGEPGPKSAVGSNTGRWSEVFGGSDDSIGDQNLLASASQGSVGDAANAALGAVLGSAAAGLIAESGTASEAPQDAESEAGDQDDARFEAQPDEDAEKALEEYETLIDFDEEVPDDKPDEGRPTTTTARPVQPTDDWPLSDVEELTGSLKDSRTSTSSQPAPVFAPEEPLIEPVAKGASQAIDVLVTAFHGTKDALTDEPSEESEFFAMESLVNLPDEQESAPVAEELSKESSDDEIDALFDFSAVDEPEAMEPTSVGAEQSEDDEADATDLDADSLAEAPEAEGPSEDDQAIIDSLRPTTGARNSDTAEYTDETLNDESLIEGFSDGLASALSDTPDPPRLETGIVPVLPDISFDLEEDEEIFVHELHGKSNWIPVVSVKRPTDISAIASYLISHIDGVSSFAELRGTVGLPPEAVDKGFLELIETGALRARRPE